MDLSNNTLIISLDDLIKNIKVLEIARTNEKGVDQTDYLNLIKRGNCFLPYRTISGLVAFAPSRFIGYKNNDFNRHSTNQTKDGRETNPTISNIIGAESKVDKEIESLYIKFCQSIFMEPRTTGSFGRLRKYWPIISIEEDIISNGRAIPSKRQFTVGDLYSRDQIADIIKLSEKQRKGNWLTGYSQHNKQIFIFANVGIAGRTGHDYANRWSGKNLIWYGKSRSELHQPEMTSLLAGDLPVHVFWRAADRSPFSYAGLAVPLDAVDGPPAQVTWLIDEVNGTNSTAPPIKTIWRRGPPPTPGERISTRSDGPTNVYLLVLEGPLSALFPTLAKDGAVVKIGMSNDTTRRIADLSSGFPPGCNLHWRLAAERRFPNGADAFVVETRLLERLRIAGRAIGGEFAIVPNAELQALSTLQ